MKKILLTMAAVLTMSFSAQARLYTDIVDTAVEIPQFTTLVAAVQAAGLVSALKGEGPLTVFAPRDSAFAKLPAGTVENLLRDVPALTNVLTYHVVAGEPSLRSLAKMGTAMTLQGQQVQISKKGHAYFVNGTEILGHVSVKNGQIFIIDSVLLPR